MPYHLAMSPDFEKGAHSAFFFLERDDEARTRYLHLGKVALYQMSYVRYGASDRNRTNDTGISVPCSTN